MRSARGSVTSRSSTFDPFDTLTSTRELLTSRHEEPIHYGVLKPPPAIVPVPVGETSIINFEFKKGIMGLTLDDAQGGTRVVVTEVAEGSPADRLGVPVGGILMKVGNRRATGRQLAQVTKWIAAAERPLVLQIMHPGGAAAAAELTTVKEEADDPFAVVYNAPIDVSTSKHPGAKLGPISTHQFQSGPLGFKELLEIDEGVVVSAVAPGSAAATSGVPIGGVIIAVNDEEAKTGKVALNKQMAAASKPMTLLVAAASSSHIAASAARREKEANAQAAAKSNSGVTPYKFEQAALGITFEDAEGDSRGVVVSRVSGAAEALGVPIGGMLVRINFEGVPGKSKAEVNKMLSKVTERPLTLYIRPGGSAAAAAAAKAEAAANPESARAAAPAADSSRENSQRSHRGAQPTTRGGGSKKSTTPRGGKSPSQTPRGGTPRGGKKAKKTKKAQPSARALSHELLKRTASQAAKIEAVKKEKAKKEEKDKEELALTTRAQTARAEPPPSRKVTFGPGPLGLGLSDAESGGVTVTEVMPQSAAAEQRVDVGTFILALNGSDVTGHGKVSLSKMIGYLPRPLVVTFSLLHQGSRPGSPSNELAAADGVGRDASPTTEKKEKVKQALKPKALKPSSSKPRDLVEGADKPSVEHGESSLLENEAGGSPAAASRSESPNAARVRSESPGAARALVNDLSDAFAGAVESEEQAPPEASAEEVAAVEATEEGEEVEAVVAEEEETEAVAAEESEPEPTGGAAPAAPVPEAAPAPAEPSKPLEPSFFVQN